MQSCRRSVGPEHTQHSLSLVCPGLLPGPDQAAGPVRCPAIEKFLCRARRAAAPAQTLENLTYRLFGYPVTESVPVAAVIRHAVAGDAAAGDYWILATPAHVAADRTQLRLLDPGAPLTAAQSQQLVEALNTHFQSQGLKFVAVSPRQWLVKTQVMPAVEAPPYRQVLGRPVTMPLPAARDREARRWPALLNEIQMLLFAHPVNQQREADGLLPVNSVWCWGGGRLPAGCDTAIRRVYADTLFAQGLAKLNAVDCDTSSALAAALSNERPAGPLLYIDTSLIDTVTGHRNAASQQQLADRLEPLFAVLLQALKQGVVERVSYYSLGKYNFELDRRALYRVWRRRRPLDAWS